MNESQGMASGEVWMKPTQRTRMILRQQNLSNLRIDNLVREYLDATPSEARSEKEFHTFAMAHVRAAVAVQDKRALQDGWSPNDRTIAELKEAGISTRLSLTLAERFNASGAGLGCVGPRDLIFKDYALREYERMRFAGELPLPTDQKWLAELIPQPLPRRWIPRRRTVDKLTAEGIPVDFMEFLLPTFRLYWHERADCRDDWEGTFARHVRFKWEQRPARESDGGGDR